MHNKNQFKTNPKNLLSLLFSQTPKLLIFAMFTGLLAGIGFSLIVPFIFEGLAWSNENTLNESETTGVVQENFVLLYFLLCAIILLLRSFSLISVTIVTRDIMTDLRISLCKKLNRAPVKSVEDIGLPKLINILTQDLQFIYFAAVGIPILFIEGISIVGLLTYLFYLDWKIFIFLCLALIVGVILSRYPLIRAEKYFSDARVALDKLQEGVRGIIFGGYELKLNNEKSSRYIQEEIEQPERETARYSKIGDSLMMCAGNLASLISFIIIGLIAFVLPKYMDIASSHILSVVMVLLYIISPISVIFSIFPNISRGNVALKHTMKIYQIEEEEIFSSVEIPEWNKLVVRNIKYSYDKSATHETFKLQAENLTFEKGKINFIVGGNGSGKSTLSKIISLHYSADEGDICFGNTKIANTNIAQARTQIAVIYSNYFLFDKLYTHITPEEEIKVAKWLDMLELSDKTSLVNGRFTTTNLSDGQRRRLALLVALLENRKIYVLDEWAADQDPVFKKIFYTKIIHNLKAENKLVIVVTHDDRYFDHADKIIFMENGKVVKVKDKNSYQPAKELESIEILSPEKV